LSFSGAPQEGHELSLLVSSQAGFPCSGARTHDGVLSFQFSFRNVAFQSCPSDSSPPFFERMTSLPYPGCQGGCFALALPDLFFAPFSSRLAQKPWAEHHGRRPLFPLGPFSADVWRPPGKVRPFIFFPASLLFFFHFSTSARAWTCLTPPKNFFASFSRPGLEGRFSPHRIFASSPLHAAVRLYLSFFRRVIASAFSAVKFCLFSAPPPRTLGWRYRPLLPRASAFFLIPPLKKTLVEIDASVVQTLMDPFSSFRPFLVRDTAGSLPLFFPFSRYIFLRPPTWNSATPCLTRLPKISSGQPSVRGLHVKF